MRSHKYRDSYNKYLKLKKWEPYVGYKNGRRYSKILPSLHFENQTWGALHKCWVGYCIAINKGEFDNEIKYANRIQKLQRELGLEVSDFECLEDVDEEDIKLIEESMTK
jgi:hypothetical protein